MIEMGYWPDKGYVLCGDAVNACAWLSDMHCAPGLVVADPPYGGILKDDGTMRTARLESRGRDSGGPWMVVLLHGDQPVLVHPDRIHPVDAPDE